MDYFIASTILACGFSAISAMLLLCLYLFSLPAVPKSLTSRAACASVLGAIFAIQTLHFQHFAHDISLLQNRFYISLVVITPPSLYFFARITVFQEKLNTFSSLIHCAPIILSFALPNSSAFTLAFTLGAAYTIWLATRLYALRQYRARFSVEIFFFSLFAVTAVSALVLGLLLPLVDLSWFYIFFANSISAALICVVFALLAFPSLIEDVVTITSRAYSNSKLDGVDIDHSLDMLNRLFVDDHIFKDDSINLTRISELLQLSPHQVSELINTHQDMNFPNFVKKHRVEAATQQLLSEPKASVLTISLENGFKSQSAFYAAFKEVTGQTPGSFRKASKT